MPQEITRVPKHNHPTGSRWHKFHFSGKVIMCSVLFGLGLVLIGGLIFAIASDNDDKSKPGKDNQEMDIPPKAPTSFVGSAIMGIGAFIVTVGIIMCLFETEVCRKRSADSSPLISEGENDCEPKDSEPAAIPTASKAHTNHRHGTRKKSPSPRRHKAISKKSHSSKDRIQKKTPPSPSSPPIEIEKSNKFLTTSTSDEKFLTPPNTFHNESTILQSNSREAEIQTSSSLMKSFTSSEPSWNVSTEFQTPATSFRDTSLEDSTRIGEMESSASSVNVQILDKQKIIADSFPTPITPLEEKEARLSSSIQMHEAEAFTESETLKKEPSQSNAFTLKEKMQTNETPFISGSHSPLTHDSQGLITSLKPQSCSVEIGNETKEIEQNHSNKLPYFILKQPICKIPFIEEKILNDNEDMRNSIPNAKHISKPSEKQSGEKDESDIVASSVSIATDSVGCIDVGKEEKAESGINNNNIIKETVANLTSNEEFPSSNESYHESENLNHSNVETEEKDEMPETDNDDNKNEIDNHTLRDELPIINEIYHGSENLSHASSGIKVKDEVEVPDINNDSNKSEIIGNLTLSDELPTSNENFNGSENLSHSNNVTEGKNEVMLSEIKDDNNKKETTDNLTSSNALPVNNENYRKSENPSHYNSGNSVKSDVLVSGNDNRNETEENIILRNELPISNENYDGSENLSQCSDQIEVNEGKIPTTVTNIPENLEELDCTQNQFSGEGAEEVVNQNLQTENDSDVKFNDDQLATLSHEKSSNRRTTQSISEESVSRTTSISNSKTVIETSEDNSEKKTDLRSNDPHNKFPISSAAETRADKLISKDDVLINATEKLEEFQKVDSS